MNKVAIIGLGRMGKNIALHLLEQGVDVVAYNRSLEKVENLKSQSSKLKTTTQNSKVGNVSIAATLAEIPKVWDDNRPVIVVLYVPSGAATDEVLFGAAAPTNGQENDGPREKVQPGLVDVLPQGSIIVDGGNSFFKDSQKRYREIQAKGIYFLDMGTSGGLEGARNGACLMVGGDEEVYKQIKPILTKIATKDGYGYFGPSGCGHFVKMVHNAVEYGMMGAIAEGFELVHSSIFMDHSQKEIKKDFKVDLAKLARVWAHGSIVSGLLMDKAQSAFEKDPTLETITGEVPRGETEAEMEWLGSAGIPNPVIQRAREQRVESRSQPSFIGKVIAALRREFGGHKVKEKNSV